jgi:hypothetical protein
MKNQKANGKPKTTARKSVARAIKKTDKENFEASQCSDREIQESIALKAYDLYVQRGYTNGNDLEDWLTAERLVLNKYR